MVIMFDDLEVTNVCLSWNLITEQNITLVNCLRKWLYHEDLSLFCRSSGNRQVKTLHTKSHLDL